MAVSRRQTFLHALAFVLGFSLVFVSLGASVALVGYALHRYIVWIERVGGALLIVFGLGTMGLIKLPFLYVDRRVQMQAKPQLGYLSSLLMGIVFSAGWIPCVGPVLAAIYLLASNSQTVAKGALLLAAYSLGLGLPFLITGAAFSVMTGLLRRLNRYLDAISKVTGLFLLAIGVLLLFDQFQPLSGWIIARLGSGLATAELSGGDASTVTLPLAFLAGLLSFLSPCVLPIIPGYLGYLSGAAVLASSGPNDTG
jgi:cytochrome c-type biogenesis protein